LSGEKLIDDPDFKAELFDQYPQAIGGEMEGAGLVAAALRGGVPWLLVKAVCDWGDGKKHSKHQPLAAAAAVSLSHHVLSQSDVLHGLVKSDLSDKMRPPRAPEAATGDGVNTISAELRLRKDAATCSTAEGPTHWFRLWITNSAEAEGPSSVEVIAYRAFNVAEEGGPRSIPGFAQSHLVWTYDLDQHKNTQIPPSMGQLCDIGYIPRATSSQPGIAPVFPGRVGEDTRPFILHTRFQPSSPFNELRRGNYKIELAIVTDGSKSDFYTLDISWTGRWREDIESMIGREITFSLTQGRVVDADA
jgi:hypothetical protein